jgi:hypothetical protein
MGRRLREIRPNLTALGWRIDLDGRSSDKRRIIIDRNKPENGVTTVSAVTVGVSHDDANDSNDDIVPLVKRLDPWDGEGIA